MEYKIYKTREEIESIIPLLLEYKIYQYKTWRMYHLYKNQSLIDKICVCFVEKKPVGASLYCSSLDRDYNTMVFVIPEKRRLGIGSKLVSILEVKDILAYDVGYRIDFWRKCGVKRD